MDPNSQPQQPQPPISSQPEQVLAPPDAVSPVAPTPQPMQPAMPPTKTKNKTVKIILIIIGVLVGLFIIMAILGAIVGPQDTSQKSSGTTTKTTASPGEKILTSTTYSVSVPDNATQDKSDDDGKSISASYTKPYGTVYLNMFYHDESVIKENTKTTYAAGTVTDSTVNISGVQTKRTDQDTRNVSQFPSSVLLYNYEVDANQVRLPSTKFSTDISIKVMSKNRLTDSEIQQFKADVDKILSSISIKS